MQIPAYRVCGQAALWEGLPIDRPEQKSFLMFNLSFLHLPRQGSIFGLDEPSQMGSLLGETPSLSALFDCNTAAARTNSNSISHVCRRFFTESQEEATRKRMSPPCHILGAMNLNRF